jgi:hypothetical protein
MDSDFLRRAHGGCRVVLTFAVAMSILVALAVAGCEQATSTGLHPQLTIDSPSQGITVATNTITISGTAPAGSRIVQDVARASDRSTTADSSGHWEMSVDLKDGKQELTFRIGDDSETAQHLTITYDPQALVTQTSENPRPFTNRETTSSPTAVISPFPTQTALPIPTASPTASPTAPTATPTATPSPTKEPATPKPAPADPYADAKAAGATAICHDGTWSFSAHRSGTCSKHGGVHWWTGNLGPAGPGGH